MDPSFQPGWVSVIVPTYNRAEQLPGTLDSVWYQTYRPLELIVVDDGSTDDTVATVKDWADMRDDDQFQVQACKQENRGPSAARNRGLVESRGQYIQFLDSDDRLHPQKIEAHAAALEAEPPCDYVWSAHTSFPLSGDDPGFSDYDVDELVSTSEYTRELALFEMTGNLWDGFYRRDLCWQTGPMHEALTRMEDVEYNIRMSALHPPGRYVEANLVARGEHEECRLTGRRHGKEGLETGFASLNVIEDTLDHFDVENGAPVRRTIANFYLGLAYVALQASRPSSFERAVEAAKRNREGRLFKTQLWALRGLRAMLGNETTARLWGKYANFEE
jgi:glycosyltransferase involved in cell wall biosynthesis